MITGKKGVQINKNGNMVTNKIILIIIFNISFILQKINKIILLLLFFVIFKISLKKLYILK